MPSDRTVKPATPRDRLGQAGESLVAQWLTGQGWQVLHRRWHCRWGELDLVARSPDGSSLALVEVKTRQANSLDRGGRLAITAAKQAKLIQAAEALLAACPELAELACRFDVAIVQVRSSPPTVTLTGSAAISGETAPHAVALGQVVAIDGYRLVLVDYLANAFDLG